MSRVLITGASSGIGRACAESFAKARQDLLLIARRMDRLKELGQQLHEKYKINVAIADVDISNRAAVDKFVVKSQALFSEIDVLVNNAGLAKGTDKLQDGSVEDWEQMINTNVKGLLYMTRAVLPHMIANQRGHIVNLGSVAGVWTYPGGGVYCATKFAVRALSEGLRMDLLGTPLRVSNIEPGMVETEFSEVRFNNSERAKSVYRGMTPLAAKDIAEAVLWCVQRPAHVNIQEMVIFPTDQAAIQHVHRRG